MVILIFNSVLGAGLQSVLSMINALQIIVMLPLLEANMPANAGMVFRYLAEIAAFDYLDIKNFIDEHLD
eukprot:CAMPEP_0185617348 /NCGR_PEP_ID=MMETSP0436-20130131/43152_1 /TAXON_ID=626734 ORGANISM="Favella taraikaensis, Strain Fe Narragansett Bay" /NCGR_SAMPLE_ID=MMETSP0436 /ASSEMBLY_ACC=CAM_ASM_000390 /LENGTH=68 /DNA_ID=CAMNT_0028254911 /DNA_START=277 /DNA_END=480 /DNA_ORIENTATION=-